MKDIAVGILAHVDAGKTTLSEALLYRTGVIRNLGRVDHKNAYLDTNRLERERGITIFSKQARFSIGENNICLLDTPGHIDFSAEMERTLSVIDYAILVISGPEGVQSHTETLWTLLRSYKVPCFIWVNKMDQLSGELDRSTILTDICRHFDANCIDMNDQAHPLAEKLEDIAVSDEAAMEEYLQTDTLKVDTIAALIKERKIFPCYFGSALKLDNVDDFIQGLGTYLSMEKYPDHFGARVYKISRDDQNNRLTWLKMTGGSLKVREMLGEEKITQIRLYSGVKFSAADQVDAGCVCCVTGLEKSFAGQGLGYESNAPAPSLQPVLSYDIVLPPGSDIQGSYTRLLTLAEEDPMLRIVWNSQLQTIQAQFMGQVQIQVLKRIIWDRFSMDVSIEQGRIMYKETIADTVEAIGHFEPLRHYAEVHFLMEPLPPGSGLIYDTDVSTDILDENWQRLILTNLAEKTHLGVLTASPITDIKITLIAGRAHLKHTEGGDFRQAVYRAVRHGLMRAKNVLLEPWFNFVLQVPSVNIGRAISDLKAMSAQFGSPRDLGGFMVISGRCPVSEMQTYMEDLLAYTKGKGHLSCHFGGYYPCHNTSDVVNAIGYEAEHDVENSPDSVFCSHGAGIIVPWNHVEEFMHIDTGLNLNKINSEAPEELKIQPKLRSKNLDLDEKELQAIMAREFGEPKRPVFTSVVKDYGTKKQVARITKKEYLIVDGYNVIFAWEDLKKLAKDSFAAARQHLVDILSNYCGFSGSEMVLVFDGYKVKDNQGTKEDYGSLHVVYTQEGLSADAYIEKFVHETGKNYQVKVVSSDGMIQLVALQLGVIRVSSTEFKIDVDRVLDNMRKLLDEKRPDKITLADRNILPRQ